MLPNFSEEIRREVRLMTAHTLRTEVTLTPHHTNGDMSSLQLEQENSRLRLMIAELLIKNQSLRWKLQGGKMEV
ncbi:hypothetical protein ACPOL_1004 [Acidisarcina polymorpha]|uniref:Uncharacterized protein n=1 Tax=Acidisarcina polymorpha TaxID=2211140 RepID=A0A2Z5FVG7_9BACT|nr:hypothetical protein ACPOL_1004 [Acidisarcina polymorpha]